MEGVLAKNRFVWGFMASLHPVWKTSLSLCAIRAETVSDDYYSTKNNILNRGKGPLYSTRSCLCISVFLSHPTLERGYF